MSGDDKVVVLGSGGHARAVAEAATSSGFAVEEFVGLDHNDNTFKALLQRISLLDLSSTSLALGVGTNHVRARLHQRVITTFPHAVFPPIIHHTAWVSTDGAIDDGAILLAFASVGPGAHARVGSLLNTGASLDHDSTVGDYGSLGPGARTGGDVSIGSRTMVGMQAGILHGRTVGDDSVIGAHSAVVHDIPSLCVAYGTPCRVIRKRNQDEDYY